MNNFNTLSQFILSLKYFITNLTFENFQIFCHKSYIWKVLIMNSFNMLSQFIFSFKYFIINLTFEKFFSWTILICFLNLYILSNMICTTNLTFEKFQIFCHRSYIWKVLIMNNFIMLSHFFFFQICHYKSHIWKVSNILSQILHLKSCHHEQFTCAHIHKTNYATCKLRVNRGKGSGLV